MPTYSDANITHYATLYTTLNKEFQLLQRGIELGTFIEAPKHYQKWIEIYDALDAEHQLNDIHCLSFIKFLDNPACYQYWINIYMRNKRLFHGREAGGCIFLVQFLMHPAEIFEAVLQHDAAESVATNEFRPLLMSQQMTQEAIDTMEQYSLQELYEKQLKSKKRNRDMQLHGDHLVQPFHRYAQSKKRKTGGALNV